MLFVAAKGRNAAVSVATDSVEVSSPAGVLEIVQRASVFFLFYIDKRPVLQLQPFSGEVRLHQSGQVHLGDDENEHVAVVDGLKVRFFPEPPGSTSAKFWVEFGEAQVEIEVVEEIEEGGE